MLRSIAYKLLGLLLTLPTGAEPYAEIRGHLWNR